MSDIETFRHETQQWLETNCPAGVRGPDSVLPDVVWGGRRQTFDHDDVKIWLERLAERGWTVPTWPKEYGGAGLTAEQDKVLREEMRAIGTRSPLFSFGMAMLAPVLMEYATEEQKLEHLPKIARGEIRWCQGYSEPGAGSDLAGLRTRALAAGIAVYRQTACKIRDIPNQHFGYCLLQGLRPKMMICRLYLIGINLHSDAAPVQIFR